MSKVTDGSTVELFFQLRFEDGTVADSNRDTGPASCKIGQGILLSSIENALIGMREGETQQLVLKPEQAYGYADPNAFIEIPINELPEEAREVGKTLTAEDEVGEQRVVIVTELSKDTAKLDMNHPYAGRTLIFDLEVVSVQN